MHGIRTSSVAVWALLVALGGAACGDDDGATELVERDVDGATTLTVPGSDPAEELADGARRDADVESVAPSDFPVAPAPGALADAVLPVDEAGVVSLFRTLPNGLLGAEKELEASAPGQLDARYQLASRASPIGFQALDIASSFFGDLLPEPTVEQLMALFAQGADWDVEAFGREGDRYWVLWSTTGSGDGIDGIESISTVTFGDAGSPWAFIVAAADPRTRDDLLTAFVTAAAAVPEPSAAGPDDDAAAAALLTADEIGPEWRRRIDLSDDGDFHELATGVMRDEPACAAALDWIAGEDVTLTGWLDIIAVGALTSAESPSLVNLDGRVSVEHHVAVFETAELATQTFVALRELGWYECVLAVFPELVQAMAGAALPGAGATVEAPRTRPLAIGDDSIATRYEIALEAPDAGGTIKSFQDVSIVVVGRAISAVVQQSAGEPFDEELVDEIVLLAAESVRAQFG